MDNNYNNQPDNGQDYTYSGNGDSAGASQNHQEQQYTDPNSGYSYGGGQEQGGYYNQNVETQYQGQSQYQNYHYNPNYNQQYGGNGGYNSQQYGGMDTSPMSMGDWVLTILALMIPCAGIILYFVWAFGKNGNINRRNYCRAALIIEAVVLVLTILVMFVFGAALFSAYPTYGY